MAVALVTVTMVTIMRLLGAVLSLSSVLHCFVVTSMFLATVIVHPTMFYIALLTTPRVATDPMT